MKIFGIVLEANPLHLGHKYFITKIKNDFNPDVLIAITSTSFSMRGDISVLNKFDKTKLLLDEGIDIVIELPFSLSVQSADFFASNSVKILNNFGITDLAFGCETTDLILFEKVLNLTNKKKNTSVKDASKKQSFSNYLRNENFTSDEIKIIENPNFTLGLQYVNCIKENNYNIKYHLIQRISNNYHDISLNNNIASATSIRISHKNKVDISSYIPYSKNYLIDSNTSDKILANIAYNCYVINESNTHTDFIKKEGIHNYIKNNGIFNNGYLFLTNNLSNKKYTSSTIARSILHNILETKDKFYYEEKYLRILGSNKKGFEYINSLNKDTKKYIFSNPNEIINKEHFINIKNILDIELRSTKLYGLITENLDLITNEYKLPIRKD